MNMNRREFLLAGGAALACSLTRGAEENGAAKVGAIMRGFVSGGLYRGLACASNHGVLLCEGRRTLAEDSDPITPNSLFDLASVGKTQTAALCALLYTQGKLDPDAPFTEYLTEHVLAKENCQITVRDLATHSGGFDNSKPYQTPDTVKMFEELYKKRPVWPRATHYEYACSNFIYLGLIVEKLTGYASLDTAARAMLWGPLGMTYTTWNTIVGNPNAVECPQSTYSGPVRQIGEHNDLSCHYAPRPMGNGSSFSSAPEMLLFLTDMLERRTFPKAYYDLQFSVSYNGNGHRRSFGWEMTSETSSFTSWCATGFSDQAICHTGWTGPAVAVDPVRGFAGVVLGNRLASKEQTMGPRMRLLDVMASRGASESCIESGTIEREPPVRARSAVAVPMAAVTAAGAVARASTILDTRTSTEATSNGIALDTRPPTNSRLFVR